MKAKSISIILLVICLFSCGNNQRQEQPAEYYFEITGTWGKLDWAEGTLSASSNLISFTDTEGNHHTSKDVENGWTYSWKQTGTRFISITAGNVSNTGDITIKLFRNNKLIETNTGFGSSYAIITGTY